MSKPPKLSLKSIVAASVSSSVQRGIEVATIETPHLAVTTKTGGTLKERARQLSVYLEPPVYEQLRELAYTERTKMHGLMLEAVDLLFKKRGALSIRQLTDDRDGR